MHGNIVYRVRKNVMTSLRFTLIALTSACSALLATTSIVSAASPAVPQTEADKQNCCAAQEPASGQSCCAAQEPASGQSCCAPVVQTKVDAAEIKRLLDQDSEPGCDPARFYQAKYLINSCNDFLSKAKPLHERMQEDILIAKTLQGEADMSINSMPTNHVQLKGKALEDAKRQYATNLQSFASHAQAYQAALQKFQRDIGECHASQAQYDQQRSLYTLHCNQFHVANLPDLPPPHVCGALNMAEGDAARISGQIRADEQELAAAVATARQRNSVLAEGSRMAQTNILNTVKHSVRDQEEQKLSGQFGRLKEEYELLAIQGKALSPTVRKQVGATVRTTTVSATMAK